MVKKYMPENLKHAVTKKIKKYSHFQTIATKNSKHVSDFRSNNTDSFMKLLPNNTTHIPESKNTDIFRELLVNNTTEFISSNSNIFGEFLPYQTTVKTFFRVHTTQKLHFQRVTTKKYRLIQNSCQAVFIL